MQFSNALILAPKEVCLSIGTANAVLLCSCFTEREASEQKANLEEKTCRTRNITG